MSDSVKWTDVVFPILTVIVAGMAVAISVVLGKITKSQNDITNNLAEQQRIAQVNQDNITNTLTLIQYGATQSKSKAEIAFAWEKSTTDVSTALGVVRTWVHGNDGHSDTQGVVTGSADFAGNFYDLSIAVDPASLVLVKSLKTARDTYRSFWVGVKTSNVTDKAFWVELDNLWLHRARLYYNLIVPLDMARAKADWQKEVNKHAAIGQVYAKPLKYKRHAALTFCMKAVEDFYPDGRRKVEVDWRVLVDEVWVGRLGGEEGNISWLTPAQAVEP